MNEFRTQITAIVDATRPVTASDILDRAEPPRGRASARQWTPPARLAVALTVLAAMVVVAVTVIAVGGPTPRRSASSPSRVGWQLVSDVAGTWQSLSGVPAVLNGLPDVRLQCVSTTTCYVYGISTDSAQLVTQLDVTTDAGQTWSVVTLPATMGPGSRLACADSTTCALLGVDASGTPRFDVTTDGGATWAAPTGKVPLAPNDYVNDLACTSATACAAIVTPTSGNGGFASAISAGPSLSEALATTDGGAHWSRSAMIDSPAPDSLRCVGVTCVVSIAGAQFLGAGGLMYSGDGGATWSVSSGTPTSQSLGAIDCGDASHCLTVSRGFLTASTSVYATSDAGKTWAQTAAAGLPHAAVTSVSCVSSTTCWAGGVIDPANFGPASGVGSGPGVIAQTTDFGQTWQEATLPSSVHSIFGISCPTASTCFAAAVLSDNSGSYSLGLISNGKS